MHLHWDCMVDVLQTKFFIRFKEANPEIIVGERSFCSLKPFFIKAMKERNTCCCIYHVELNELRIALNKYHVTRPKDHLCQHGMVSESCEASGIEFEGLTPLWESVVCPKSKFDEWHDVKCLYGDCGRCGIQKLPLCKDEEKRTDGRPVEWRRFAYEETLSKKGKVLKKLNLVYKKTTTDVFFDYLKPKL